MNEGLTFLKNHRRRGALVDANLLLVYVVGKVNRRQLSQMHHTKQYEGDFELIEGVVELFPKLYTTPNVLTEVSNLGKKLGGEFFSALGRVITVLDERYCSSVSCAGNPHFQKLGLTDAGLLSLAAEALIVTADFPLYQTLRASRIDAVNFNHLRPLGWGTVRRFIR